jgi:hypothetical protein
MEAIISSETSVTTYKTIHGVTTHKATVDVFIALRTSIVRSVTTDHVLFPEYTAHPHKDSELS